MKLYFEDIKKIYIDKISDVSIFLMDVILKNQKKLNENNPTEKDFVIKLLTHLKVNHEEYSRDSISFYSNSSCTISILFPNDLKSTFSLNSLEFSFINYNNQFLDIELNTIYIQKNLIINKIYPEYMFSDEFNSINAKDIGANTGSSLFISQAGSFINLIHDDFSVGFLRLIDTIYKEDSNLANRLAFNYSDLAEEEKESINLLYDLDLDKFSTNFLSFDLNNLKKTVLNNKHNKIKI